jgi:hypothetical protein
VPCRTGCSQPRSTERERQRLQSDTSSLGAPRVNQHGQPSCIAPPPLVHICHTALTK